MFLPPDNVCFSENVACFVFLKHPFWDSPFCLVTDELKDQYVKNRKGAGASRLVSELDETLTDTIVGVIN